MAGEQVNSRNKRNAHEKQRALKAQEKRQRRISSRDLGIRTEEPSRVTQAEYSVGRSAAEIAGFIASGGTGSSAERPSPSRKFRGRERW